MAGPLPHHYRSHAQLAVQACPAAYEAKNSRPSGEQPTWPSAAVPGWLAESSGLPRPVCSSQTPAPSAWGGWFPGRCRPPAHTWWHTAVTNAGFHCGWSPGSCSSFVHTLVAITRPGPCRWGWLVPRPAQTTPACSSATYKLVPAPSTGSGARGRQGTPKVVQPICTGRVTAQPFTAIVMKSPQALCENRLGLDASEHVGRRPCSCFK